jgi:hypothetical protein
MDTFSNGVDPEKPHIEARLRWIHYQLDNFSTVDEVMASDNSVRSTSDF